MKGLVGNGRDKYNSELTIFFIGVRNTIGKTLGWPAIHKSMYSLVVNHNEMKSRDTILWPLIICKVSK